MRKMLRLTEAEFLERVDARLRSAFALDGAAGRATRVSLAQERGAAQEGTGSGDSQGMGSAEGWVVMPYPVSCNRVWRQANGRVIPNTKAVAWKRQAAESARLAGVQIMSGPVEIHCRLHPRANKDGTPSKTRLDCDAPLKALLDALNGVAYADDKQVHKIVAEIAGPVAGGALSVRVKGAA